ncbi:hypothetical protein NDU88_001791 [Pleurodeles waltl]|uniref:Uncharacterized protein n=1 Tax=Pleurodeles waltl TaxID=8319 RepID=A0AAV7U938_PLEWA|nr:hypothetical protein NDU88_001791 [Pleurodeles waltl]
MPQAQSDGQLKTPDGQLGPIAEHAHVGAARLRSSHDRGRSCGAEQMKTELFGNCCSITPNACMLKGDPADREVCTSHATLEGWSDSGGGGVMGEGTLRILLDNAHRLRYVHKTL